MKILLRLLFLATALVALVALADTRVPVTATISCANTATQFPAVGPVQNWSVFDGTTKSVWIGTSASVTAGPNSSYGWVASNGGVFTSTLVDPSKVWCISFSGTNILNFWGEK